MSPRIVSRRRAPRILLAVVSTLTVFSAFDLRAAEFNGLLIREGGQVIASAWNGVASGEISVEHEEMTDSLFVTFLRPDSTEFVPGTSPTWTLGRLLADPSIASTTSLGDWLFNVTGDLEGMTTITLTADSSGTTQYTSPPIELHVEEHFEADGMILRSGGEVIVSVWQGVVTGEIEVEHEEMTDSIFVSFLTPDSVEVVINDSEFEMQVTVANPAAVGFVQLGDWSFKLEGLMDGVDSLRVCILHENHCDFNSPWIEVHVEEHFEADGIVLRQGGLEIARVFQGVVTGDVDVGVGGVTGLIDVSFLDASGIEIPPPDEPEFSMVGTESNVSLITFEPTSDWQFRIHGLVASTTGFDICVLHEGHCDFTTPEIPIEVKAPTDVGGNDLPEVMSIVTLQNPIHGATSIRYAVGSPMHVDINVFDVRGRRVQKLLSAVQDPGQHSLLWDTDALASGIYFVRVQVPMHIRTQKIVLQR